MKLNPIIHTFEQALRERTISENSDGLMLHIQDSYDKKHDIYQITIFDYMGGETFNVRFVDLIKFVKWAVEQGLDIEFFE